MFGRAGRNGCSARGHLLHTAMKRKQPVDPNLECFYQGKENCRRAGMLKNLGSSEVVVGGTACCDICSGGEVPYARLDVLIPTPLKRVKKPKPVRSIDTNLERVLRETILHERDAIFSENAGYRMLGASFVIPDSTISQLCLKASKMSSEKDLHDIPTLRPEYCHRFFSLISSVIAGAPPPLRKERRGQKQ